MVLWIRTRVDGLGRIGPNRVLRRSRADKFIHTSVLLCIYMHRLKWSLIAKKSVCLVDPMSMLPSRLLSQILSQLRSQHNFDHNINPFFGHVWSYRDVDREKKRACVGQNIRWSMKTRSFAGPDVLWRVTTRGFVGLDVHRTEV